MTSAAAKAHDSSKTPYPAVDASPDFPALEKDILNYWKDTEAFKTSVQARAAKLGGGNNEFIFYDGPPFANGLPHYGHLLTGFVKDVFARYQTMKGKRTERRFGWDCHGLPAEMGAEKELGISGRAAIEKFGIRNFNEHCRTSVMKYTTEWEDYVTRQARWVDFADDYKTMDINFMESVLWAFKQLFDKGLVYESHRVMPYSWAAETPLSNFETKLDNAYREREDKAITVAFKLKEKPKGAPEAKNYYLLAWTTTPWTLPSNLALAVKDDLDYVATLREDGDCIIAAKFYAPEAEGVNLKGADLLGLSYEPLFPYFAESATAPKTALKDAVLETERTYLRPFREEDYQAFHAMLTDPKVYETTSDGLLPDEVIRKEFDRFVSDHAKKGFSQWAVINKKDGAFMGRAGWDNRDYDQFNTTGKSVAELRYAYRSEFWNQGYAVEVATALQDWAVFNVKAEIWSSGCNPTYEPALKALKRLGHTPSHIVQFRNQPVLFHSLEASAWRQKRGLQPHAFKIISGDFIEEGSGTGVVHIAPGFGEDDQRVSAQNGIDVVVPVDGQGKYTDELFDWEGLSLKGLNVVADTRKSDAEPYTDKQLAQFGLVNLRIIRNLKDRGLLVKEEQYKHNYPHCWRTDTPLIYRAMPSWYVAVTKFRDRAVEVNKTINWIPEHIRDGQMQHMLATAPDWSISRNRFWGTPIPVWRAPSGKLIVCGSIAEIEQLSGKKVTDLHRPYIDEITFERDGETYTRVTDVFDCWFESGSMPFAQVHYPFENKEWFDEHFPADFITEYVGQTRGWFNTLIMLSTALFDRAPFKNCICHGVVLDSETGLKYSKRLKNYKDPMEVFNAFGADALRWMMLDSPVMRGLDISVDPEGKFIRDSVRLYVKPIWNAYNFFTLYANADNLTAKLSLGSENVMDRYILSKLATAVKAVEQGLDAYDTPTACQAITTFFEVLNNWYIRRNKERFWKAEHDADKQAAYDTLFTALHVMSRAAAPLLPLVSEAIYLGLTAHGAENSAKDSVHLALFPAAEMAGYREDAALMANMDFVQAVCNAALGVRNKQNIRVRQPLSTLTVEGERAVILFKDAQASLYLSLVQDEINVKQVVLGEDMAKHATLKIQVNLPKVGKSLGAKVKDVMGAAKNGQWTRNPDGTVTLGGVTLQADEVIIQLEPNPEYKDSAQALSTNDALVVLDLNVTPELEAEGISRDLVRMIQQARKDNNLNVSDRIALSLDLPEASKAAVQQFETYIKEQVLATSLAYGEAKVAQHYMADTLNDEPVVIGFSVVKAA